MRYKKSNKLKFINKYADFSLQKPVFSWSLLKNLFRKKKAFFVLELIICLAILSLSIDYERSQFLERFTQNTPSNSLDNF